MIDINISFIIIMIGRLKIVYNYLSMQKQQLNITLTPEEQHVFGTLTQFR